MSPIILDLFIEYIPNPLLESHKCEYSFPKNETHVCPS
jgi:hypothetical protein